MATCPGLHCMGHGRTPAVPAKALLTGVMDFTVPACQAGLAWAIHVHPQLVLWSQVTWPAIQALIWGQAAAAAAFALLRLA